MLKKQLETDLVHLESFKYKSDIMQREINLIKKYLKLLENPMKIEVGKRYKLKEGRGICLWEKNENKLDLLNVCSIEYTITEKYKNWFDVEYATLSFKCKQDNQHTIQVDLFTFKSMFEIVEG